MTVAEEPKSHKDLPWWAFDGSSTYQATGDNSDMRLKPVRLFKDPFRGGKNKIVLCETHLSCGKADKSNKRSSCEEAMEKIKDKKPWFGLGRTRIHHAGCGGLALRLAQAKGLSSGTGSLLLRRGGWKSFRTRYHRSTLQSVSLHGNGHWRNQHGGYAGSSGVSDRAYSGSRRIRPALDVAIRSGKDRRGAQRGHFF